MKFDNPKYVERYEDVIFEPQVALNPVIANGQHQAMKKFRFIVDNTDEVTVFNWGRARLSVDFKVNLSADGADITLVDHNGIVNRAHSLIRDLHHIRCRTSEKPLRAPENKFNNLQDQHVS